jgi:hypothetical protein
MFRLPRLVIGTFTLYEALKGIRIESLNCITGAETTFGNVAPVFEDHPDCFIKSFCTCQLPHQSSSTRIAVCCLPLH